MHYIVIHIYIVDISCTTAFILLLFTPGELGFRKYQASMFTVALFGAGFPVDFLLGSNGSKTGEAYRRMRAAAARERLHRKCAQNPKLRNRLIVNLCNAYLIHCIS